MEEGVRRFKVRGGWRWKSHVPRHAVWPVGAGKGEKNGFYPVSTKKCSSVDRTLGQ